MPGKSSLNDDKIDNRVPVTVITGFLGSGKTTLLNHILTEKHGMKVAVIENEFGAVGVDDMLVKKKMDSEEEIIEMMNGCVCCTVRGDLIEVIKRILKRGGKKKIDAIIIETTGLADPAPVAQTFFVDDYIANQCRLDAIITVVDAKHIIQHLDDEKPEGVENESVEQVAFADKILLNKTDLVSMDELASVKHRLRSINATVEILECQYGKVDPHLLLNIEGFCLEKILEAEPDFLKDDDHMHDKRVTSISFDHEVPVNIGKLQDWISTLMKTKGTDLLRYKGIINVMGMPKKFVFQGVHMLFDGAFMDEWGPGERRHTRFVFIGKDLDREALINGFLACQVDENHDLRFKLGDAVRARVKGGFKPGTVIKTWDEGNPYRVLMATGEEVWVPDDTDVFVISGNK